MSLIYTSPNATIPGKKRNSIYLGGQSDAKSLEKLERWGISHILNVTPSKDSSMQAGVPNYFEKSKQFVYKRIPIYDTSTSKVQLKDKIPEIIQFITNGLFHGSVLVHCKQGISRSTTCVLFYLLSKAELSLENAMALIKRRRPDAQPIPSFYELLEEYDKEQEELRQTKLKTTTKRTTDNNDNNDDDDDDDDDSNTEKKKKKRQRRMQGPSMPGPTVSPKPSPNNNNNNDNNRRPMVGPSMPPATKTTSKDKKSGKHPIGPSMVGPSIGPMMKPSPKNDSNMIGPSIGPAIGPSIGPAIGPSIGPAISPSMGPLRKSEPSIGPALKNDEATMIGPSIGPPMGTTNKPKESSNKSNRDENSNGSIIGPSLPPPPASS